MENENISEIEALDSRWYKRFSHCFFEDYEKLEGREVEREFQKREFLNSESGNPTLDYPELETFDIDRRLEELLSLKEDVIELEKNEVVKKIYRTKINESVATLRMLQATKDKDDKKFSRYADFIYGKPDEDNSSYILDSVERDISKHYDSENILLKEAAERLRLFLENVNTEVKEGGVTRDVLPSGQEIEGELKDAKEAVTVLKEALSELGIDDWTVVVDSEKGISNFSVSQEDKIIHVPSDEQLQRRAISKKKMAGLVAHEVGTHILRRHNGERSKLKLLGLGLDRYIKGEEGVSTYAEQQVTGATEFAGVARYFSIVVAKGVDGQSRDFRKTFEIMKDYRLLTQDSKNSADKAAESAYNDCVKTFRGTTGQTPGAIYPKDMAYFGNRDIWALVSKNSDAVLNFSIGKYDPVNPEHVAMLTQLGILDEDLENLES